MKKALKELIENAKSYDSSKYFNRIMFLSNGVYNGFFGKNDYNNILILAQEWNSGEWYKITKDGQCCDVFYTYKCNMSFNLDIPKEYGIPSIWFDNPIRINNSLALSSITGKIMDRSEL